MDIKIDDIYSTQIEPYDDGKRTVIDLQEKRQVSKITKLTSHEERLSTSLITPILLPSGECLAVVVYIR